MNKIFLAGLIIFLIGFSNQLAISQTGSEYFEKLSKADQKKVLQQVNPLPNDSGRHTYLKGTLWTAAYFDGIVEKIDSVAEITGDLKIQKEVWTYEDLLSIENQAIIKLYCFNENNQVVERFEYQPDRQHSGRTYGLSDSKWEYFYENDKISKLKTHYCVVDFKYKKDEIIGTENDFFGNRNVRTHLKSGNVSTSFSKRNDDPERKNYEFKYDENGRLLYSLYTHGTGKTERFYFFNEEDQLVKWNAKDFNTTNGEDILKESLIHHLEYDEFGLLRQKNTEIVNNDEFFVEKVFEYSFDELENNRLKVEIVSVEKSPYGTINYVTTYIFDQNHNWIFKSIKNLKNEAILELKARNIIYHEN
jgi:hypothetical protein